MEDIVDQRWWCATRNLCTKHWRVFLYSSFNDCWSFEKREATSKSLRPQVWILLYCELIRFSSHDWKHHHNLMKCFRSQHVQISKLLYAFSMWSQTFGSCWKCCHCKICFARFLKSYTSVKHGSVCTFLHKKTSFRRHIVQPRSTLNIIESSHLSTFHISKKDVSIYIITSLKKKIW